MFDLSNEPDASARQAARRDDELGVPFGYTNSLEGLINDGRHFGTIYAEPPWPCDDLAHQLYITDRQQRLTVDAIAATAASSPAGSSNDRMCTSGLQTCSFVTLSCRSSLKIWGFIYSGSLVWILPEFDAGDHLATVHQFLLHGVRRDSSFSKFRPQSVFFDARLLYGSPLGRHRIKSLVEEVSPFPRLHLFNEIVSMGWTSWGQSVPRPFDPDEEDNWGPDEDDDCDDEIYESEPDAQGDDLVADSPMIIDAVGEKPTPRMHP